MLLGWSAGVGFCEGGLILRNVVWWCGETGFFFFFFAKFAMLYCGLMLRNTSLRFLLHDDDDDDDEYAVHDRFF